VQRPLSSAACITYSDIRGESKIPSIIEVLAKILFKTCLRDRNRVTLTWNLNLDICYFCFNGVIYTAGLMVDHRAAASLQDRKLLQVNHCAYSIMRLCDATGNVFSMYDKWEWVRW
jgi:hypothetical protein